MSAHSVQSTAPTLAHWKLASVGKVPLVHGPHSPPVPPSATASGSDRVPRVQNSQSLQPRFSVKMHRWQSK